MISRGQKHRDCKVNGMLLLVGGAGMYQWLLPLRQSEVRADILRGRGGNQQDDLPSRDITGKQRSLRGPGSAGRLNSSRRHVSWQLGPCSKPDHAAGQI